MHIEAFLKEANILNDSSFLVYSAVTSNPYHPDETQIPETRGRTSLCVQHSSEGKTQPTSCDYVNGGSGGKRERGRESRRESVLRCA